MEEISEEPINSNPEKKLTLFDRLGTITNYFTGITLPNFGFLKTISAIFLLIFLFVPTWIKTSISNSELLGTFEKSVKIVSNNFKSFKYGGFEVTSNLVNQIAKVEKETNEIDTTKIADKKTRKEVENIISSIKETDDSFKKEIIKQEEPSVIKPIGWIYLGKSDDKNNLISTTTDFTLINQIQRDNLFTITDDVYMREETSCPRTSGKIITAIEKGKQVKGIGLPEYCSSSDSKVSAVWLKVERQ